MTLAYINSFAGLVACRVIALEFSENTFRGIPICESVTVKVTARKNRVYRCGDIEEMLPTQIVPRDKIRRRKYSTVILPYQWQP